MDEMMSDAVLCHDQAEHIRALALKEKDKDRRRVMLAISECYYLLHDQLVELEQMSVLSGHDLCVGNAETGRPPV